MIYGITLILLSILAVPSLLLAKKPNANELLDKIAPYQGWIGLLFCFWGVWGIITCVLHMNWLTVAPVWWITLLAGNLVEAVLGFMLGYGMISKYVFGKNEAAQQKGAAVLARLAPMQGKLGIIGIVVGLWVIVCSFLWTVG